MGRTVTWLQLNLRFNDIQFSLGLHDIPTLITNCDFLNNKGRDLKHEFCVLKPGRALVAITEMVSE